MKVKLLFAFLTITPMVSFCQFSDSIANKKISIGIILSPGYNYRILRGDNSIQWLIDNRNQREIPRWGYTAGLKLLIDSDKRYSLETGFLFSDKGEKTKEMDLQWGQSSPTLPIKNTFIYHYYYLDIPLIANYYFLKKGNGKFFISGGLLPNIFITQKTTSILEYNDGHKEEDNYLGGGLSRINLAITTGIGYQKEISNKLFLKVQPTFRCSIISIISAPIKGYLYSVGIDIGCYYKL